MKTKYRALGVVLVALVLVIVMTSLGLAKQRELEIWSMMNEGEPLQIWAAEIIKEFEEATGIKVKVVWAGRQVVTKVKPRILTVRFPAYDQSNAVLAIVNEPFLSIG